MDVFSVVLAFAASGSKFDLQSILPHLCFCDVQVEHKFRSYKTRRTNR